MLLKNRILELKPEFQPKLGHVVSQLYGRIGTIDLVGCGWNNKQTRNYINKLLDGLALMQVPEQSFVEYIQDNFNSENPSIEGLIKDCLKKQTEEEFEPMKNELVHNIRKHLLNLFEDKEKIEQLAKMPKAELSKKISELLKQV